MTKVYNYCCKKCWHMWIQKHDKNLKRKDLDTPCPKCKSKDVDVNMDITLSD
jgi:Zn finger protein HypA/HybF involved in hydrogenase expression